MFKSILIGIGIFAFAIATAWFLMKPDFKEPVGEVVPPPAISPLPVSFISSDSGDSLFVTFGTSTALLNGLGYSNVLLTQVEAASGAKYESKSENLSLWNKDTEVTLTRGRKVLFVGVSQDTPPTQTVTATSTMTGTSSVSELSGSWLWVETIKGEETIIPSDASAFSVSFSNGSLSGTTDCNDFSGSYSKEGDTISIGALAMSKKFCEDSQEMIFTQQFIGTATVRPSGDTLTLTHSDGTVSRFISKQ